MLLAQQQGFISVGELMNIFKHGFGENHLCGCRQPIRECPFWNAVADEAYGGMSNIDVSHIMNISPLGELDTIKMLTGWRAGAFGQEFDEYRELIARLYRAIHMVSGARVIVDASKKPAYTTVLKNIPFIDLYVIHLVRDSRAVAHSWQRKKRRLDATGSEHQQFITQSGAARSATRWARANLFTELLKPGTHYMRLRYEDYIGDIQGTLRKVVAFTGEHDALNDLQTEISEDRVQHAVWGNPVRFEKNITIQPDVKWQTEMTGMDKSIVSILTLPLLARYGYLRNGERTRQ
jgi:hypothetical protein